MPKPMKLLVEIEEIAFGRVFRALDGMNGVVSLTPVGEGVKAATGKPTGQKKGGAQSAPCLVLYALKGGVPMSRSTLTAVLVEGGKAATSTADTMKKLMVAKEVTKHGTGKNVTYKITPKGIKRYETACQIQPAK
jgi:predicted transcriptional regulator